MLTTRQGVRVLDSTDLDAFLALTGQDPVVNVFAEHRARTTNLEPRWLGGEVWGRFTGGELVAACHVGANLVPVQCTPEDARAFAERALTRSRSVSTVVGPHEPVETFWHTVSGSWGRPRELRWRQPHLEISGPPLVEPDPDVRRTTRKDLVELYPACVAMYTEEVGVSPEAGGGAELYRARVSQLISRGWSFARFDQGRLVFKAEVACASPHAAQIQGVYVRPDRRGQGLAVAGMAAVVDHVQRHVAPVVSLYVNDWNVPARRAYERVGFTQSATFSTVMF
jgi:ribosomal protein S18 acetylase RimI-like enzyme